MAISELQGLMEQANVNRRQYILEQLKLRDQVIAEYKKDEGSVLRSTQLREALSIIDNNIRVMQVEGLLPD